MKLVNFVHIYLYNVVIAAAALQLANITPSNGVTIIILVGVISGVGIRILDEDRHALTSGYLGIKQAVWFALIAPFQLYKLQLR